MMGMMNKLRETQEKVEKTKERLKTVLIDEQSSDGLLKVTITANRELKNISIADELLEDKEQLEDYLVLTLNKAISKATEIIQGNRLFHSTTLWKSQFFPLLKSGENQPDLT